MFDGLLGFAHSIGNFASNRNGLNTDTAMMAAIATATARGTATRSVRTKRLCRAAAAKRASISA